MIPMWPTRWYEIKMTIAWHDDDLKVSHANKAIVDIFIQWTKGTYEGVKKLNPQRGKIHEYIARNMTCKTSGKVKMYMK